MDPNLKTVVRRTASLREERPPEKDATRGRHSERRKTITPIVSPPIESLPGMEWVTEEDRTNVATVAAPAGAVLYSEAMPGIDMPAVAARLNFFSAEDVKMVASDDLQRERDRDKESNKEKEREGVKGEGGEGGGKEKDVTVYTIGEEMVPVKVGTVRRHKQGLLCFSNVVHFCEPL